MEINAESLLDELLESLILIDENLAANDVNSALKKTHECMAKIKSHKEIS